MYYSQIIKNLTMSQAIIFNPETKQICLREIEEGIAENEVIIARDKFILSKLPGCIRTDDVTVIIRNMIFESLKIFLEIDNKDFAQIHFGSRYPLQAQKFLLSDVGKLNLSVRTWNCLKAADIDINYKLVINFGSLSKFRNFGQKSLKEVEKILDREGITTEIRESLIRKEEKLWGTLCRDIPKIASSQPYLNFVELTSGITDLTEYSLGQFNNMNMLSLFPHFFNIQEGKPVTDPSEYEKRFSTRDKIESFRKAKKTLFDIVDKYLRDEMKRFITE